MFSISPELIQKEVQGNGEAEIEESGDEMGNPKQPFLDEEEDSHQRQLRYGVGGVYFCQGFVPDLAFAVFLSENKSAVQQIGDQHCDQKSDQVAELLVKPEAVIAGIGDQVGENRIEGAYQTKLQKLAQRCRKPVIGFPKSCL